jgi:aspartyl-tRNA(Asn)/glutamyl-tRNA(Gln) amidotransferase subunit C
MISREDVQKLAELSLLAVDKNELDTLAGEIDSILGYVSEVTKLADEEMEREKPLLRNVMRPDEITNTPGEYTEAIVAQFPDADGNSLRVKKIL